eukprot:CAMPEP_0202879844 /NCGR_PEP_ID=MMETSP1391-20130828/34179_1 /ASSEMBLY_ACC=CAM_ASM_000867 /TAXON_ID=1034604 /ORGANISM="Chlamydomonas leiostraca, Strain SAG 11-49" /LENGTH=171 /DNA_ID=CAMNT_0049562249 /DNA_START=62 /DNA_END=574 /DNA_ORIENTATION=-
MHKLLAGGEVVLLYPGGAREAFKRKDEKYKLLWPERAEFVRMAARFGATIIPFAAVGAEDGVNQVLDGRDLAALPIIGESIRKRASAVPQARRGVSASTSPDLEESFIQPLITLNAPQRFYFVFRAPITTTPDMAGDRAACDALYARVKGEVQGGLDYLLAARERDPYADL